MEGILAGILFIAVMAGIFYGFGWIVQKFFGFKLVGKFGVARELRNQDQIKIVLNNQEPEIVDKAVEECKRKHYSVTQENVLNEVLNLKEKKQEKLTQTKSEPKQSVNIDTQSFKAKEVRQLCGMFFLEFEDDLRQVGIFNDDVLFKKIAESDSITFIFQNYNKLFQLYSQGIVSEAEFSLKKKLILFKSINFTLN
jgi:hypothetical protein